MNEDAVFATLTPTNAVAKLAFSDVCDELAATGKAPPDHCMKVDIAPTGKVYDSTVHSLQRRLDREAAREPVADTDGQSHENGWIWKGSYVLDLQDVPRLRQPCLGWAVGQGPGDPPMADILLATPSFQRAHRLDLPDSIRLRFTFGKNKAVSMKNAHAPGLRIRVNGGSVTSRAFVLNDPPPIKINVNGLEYDYHSTPFAFTESFITKRRAVMAEYQVTEELDDCEAPTTRATDRKLGSWVLSQPLPEISGSVEKCWASNNKGDCAMAIVIRYSLTLAPQVTDIISRYEAVSSLGRTHPYRGRVVRLKDLVGMRPVHGLQFFGTREVALFLDPMTPRTLGQFCTPTRDTSVSPSLMELPRAQVFRDAMEGLMFLHQHGWVHCNIHPGNIGIVGTPPRAVLLDLEHAENIGQNGSVLAGRFRGTDGYVSPERMLFGYDKSSDIWAMGIIGYQLMHGHHPFDPMANPWQQGQDERSRDAFQKKHRQITRRLIVQSGDESEESFLRFGGLVAKMLAYEHPPTGRARHGRIEIGAALEHQAWQPREARPKKRQRC